MSVLSLTKIAIYFTLHLNLSIWLTKYWHLRCFQDVTGENLNEGGKSL
jgi:hypothetical protein